MKSILVLFFSFALQVVMLQAGERQGFRLEPDTAQYKGSDYSNVVQVARSIPLELAFEIAEKNPNIGYFVYTKGYQMVLEIPSEVPFDPRTDFFGLASNTNYMYDSGAFGSGYCRIFSQGDAVFFKNEGLWLGSAPGLADTYFKE